MFTPRAIPILLCLLFVISIPACYDERSMEGKLPPKAPADEARTEPVAEESDNAAFYYNKAFELMKFPPSPADAGRVNMIMQMGWEKGGGPDFIKSFEQNKPCLDLFKKGLEMEQCDFFFGKAGIQLPKGESTRTKAIWNLSAMHLVRARYHESQNRFEAAVSDCLAVLGFMHHVAQGIPFIAKVSANNCELRALVAIREMMKKHAMDEATLTLIIEGLRKHEKRHFPAWKVMDDEKKHFFTVIDWMAEQLDGAGGAEKNKDLIEALHREAHEQAEAYYALAQAAYNTQGEANWQEVEKLDLELGTESLAVYDQINTMDDLKELLLARMEEKGAGAAAYTARFLLGYYTSSPKSMCDSYNKNVDLIGSLQRQALLKK